MVDLLKVRQAAAEDIPEVVNVLARAFQDDPLASYLFPGRNRHNALRVFFGVQLRYGLLEIGKVWTTDDAAGAALWESPRQHPPDWHVVRQMLPLLPRMLSRHTLGALRLLSAADNVRPRCPHWYLATLGIEPERQGSGLGSTLMDPVLRRCDETGVPAYLEASREENVAFYESHGFKVCRELRLPGAPPLWLMWRLPEID
jgi:ribosomal protein S18 acetylase RimI-like enzyme